MKTQCIAFAGTLAIASLLLNTPAFAHAFLDHAEPRVGSELATPPTLVKIWFTMDINPALSAIQVFDATGKQVDKVDSRADPADNSLLIVSLPEKLPAGTYKVAWHAVCTDGHKTSGDFKFTIKP